MEDQLVLKSLEQQLKEFKYLFSNAPNDQIDETLKDRIKEWDEIPKAIQVLQMLDYAVMYSLASEFGISVLEMALKVSLENEGLTIHDLLNQAWWRD